MCNSGNFSSYVLINKPSLFYTITLEERMCSVERVLQTNRDSEYVKIKLSHQ